MRELKFKGWWTGGSEWLYFKNKKEKSLAFQIGGDNIELYQNDTEHDKFYLQEHETDEIHWCQYTGLKDKNGKEIYEEDYIKNEIIKGVVKFNAGCFVVYDKNNDYMLLSTCSLKTLEIIGNIYENPELLQQ